jgi:hypothetical protein
VRARDLPTLTHPRTKLSWCRFVKFKQVARAHQFMMGWGMVRGKVVGEIVFTDTPVNYKLALLDSVADPVKAHVDGF